MNREESIGNSDLTLDFEGFNAGLSSDSRNIDLLQELKRKALVSLKEIVKVNAYNPKKTAKLD